MPGSDAPRKQEHTSWPEGKARPLTSAERQARFKARQRGEDPDAVVPKRTGGLPSPEPAPPAEPPEIPADPADADASMPRDPSVRDAVARSIEDWGKTKDPLAAIAVGLGKTFDRAVRDGSAGGAATVAERLTGVLDRLRPATAPASGSGERPAKVTDPADLMKRREARLAAEAAKAGP